MNRKIRHTILFSMLGGLALSAAAWAQGDMHPGGMHPGDMHPGAGEMFERMDANHDGRISAQEHATGAQAMFARMDANHDGVLDAAEMHAGRDWKGKGMHGGRGEDGHQPRWDADRG